MGLYGSIQVYNNARSHPVTLIDIDDPFQKGDLCWLETPLNPTGESRYYSHIYHQIFK